jgi:hypothetical protein
MQMSNVFKPVRIKGKIFGKNVERMSLPERLLQRVLSETPSSGPQSASKRYV